MSSICSADRDSTLPLHPTIALSYMVDSNCCRDVLRGRSEDAHDVDNKFFYL
jgi:hypothetical protein